MNIPRDKVLEALGIEEEKNWIGIALAGFGVGQPQSGALAVLHDVEEGALVDHVPPVRRHLRVVGPGQLEHVQRLEHVLGRVGRLGGGGDGEDQRGEERRGTHGGLRRGSPSILPMARRAGQ